MKTIKIYKREVLERTGFKKHPYKEVTQYTIVFDKVVFRNHYEDINNSKLRIKFREVLNTRSMNELEAFEGKLGRTEADKYVKKMIEFLKPIIKNKNYELLKA